MQAVNKSEEKTTRSAKSTCRRKSLVLTPVVAGYGDRQIVNRLSKKPEDRGCKGRQWDLRNANPDRMSGDPLKSNESASRNYYGTHRHKRRRYYSFIAASA